jgi:hypothetical protein
VIIEHVEMVTDSDGARWLKWKTSPSLKHPKPRLHYLPLEAPRPQLGRVIHESE